MYRVILIINGKQTSEQKQQLLKIKQRFYKQFPRSFQSAHDLFSKLVLIKQFVNAENKLTQQQLTFAIQQLNTGYLITMVDFYHLLEKEYEKLLQQARRQKTQRNSWKILRKLTLLLSKRLTTLLKHSQFKQQQKFENNLDMKNKNHQFSDSYANLFSLLHNQ